MWLQKSYILKGEDEEDEDEGEDVDGCSILPIANKHQL